MREEGGRKLIRKKKKNPMGLQMIRGRGSIDHSEQSKGRQTNVMLILTTLAGEGGKRNVVKADCVPFHFEVVLLVWGLKGLKASAEG